MKARLDSQERMERREHRDPKGSKDSLENPDLQDSQEKRGFLAPLDSQDCLGYREFQGTLD